MSKSAGDDLDLANKIARLVEERGWNQEDFARISQLNRHTVRTILNSSGNRRLRNATVSQCADALGLTVNELRTLPLERLLPRMHGKGPADEALLKMLASNATLPELAAWLERNGDPADEADELLGMQASGGALERLGVEQCVEMIERRRKLLAQVKAIAATEYLELVEQVVGLIQDKLHVAKPEVGRRLRG
jgi:transcriptional regulator with XRE-family HTH domain